MNRMIVTGALGLAALLMATPATADVKAGVDAWAVGDYRKAVEEWRGPAIAGDADAQFNLGQAYKLGRGVPVDPALAESWFRKAALQNHLQAIDNYGLALFQADKKADAVPWLEKSVARGEPRTQLVLGTMLFNGDGVAKDWPRAYALMTRASAAGLQSASQTLAQMDQYITPADREKGTALAQQYAIQAATLPPAAASRPGTVDSSAPKPVAEMASVPAKAVTPAKGKSARITPARITPAKITPAKPATVAAKPAAETPKPAPATVKAPAGGWKVQLGAFGAAGGAQAQWKKVAGRMGGAVPSYAKAGSFTRLLAGPYASKTAAQKACAASGTSCVVVAP